MKLNKLNISFISIWFIYPPGKGFVKGKEKAYKRRKSQNIKNEKPIIYTQVVNK